MNTQSDYLIDMYYILYYLNYNKLDVGKTIKTLNEVKLDSHHKDDLKVKDERELAFKCFDCFEHISDVRMNNLKSQYIKEMKFVDELVQKHIFEK